MPRTINCSLSVFSVAGVRRGPLPSWSGEPAPAINSAIGGCSTPSGTVRTASMAPMRILLCSAPAATIASARTSASATVRSRSIDLARLFRQHDRDAVANRISELCRTRNQLLLGRVELQRALGQRAEQNFQKRWINSMFETFGPTGHECLPRFGRPCNTVQPSLSLALFGRRVVFARTVAHPA